MIKDVNNFYKAYSQMNESAGPVELTSIKGMLRTDAEKLVRANYPNNLTYKGHEFSKKIYMDTIIKAAGKSIGATNENAQESYLGYDPEKDTFYSGWDTFETDGNDQQYQQTQLRHHLSGDAYACVSVVKVTSPGVADAKADDNYYGMMYPDNYRNLKRNIDSIVDIRLD